MSTGTAETRRSSLHVTLRRLGILAIAAVLTGSLAGCGFFQKTPVAEAAEESSGAGQAGQAEDSAEDASTETAALESENGVELLPSPEEQTSAATESGAEVAAVDVTEEEAIPLPVIDENGEEAAQVGVIPQNRSLHAKIQDEIDRAEIVLVDDARTTNEHARAWKQKIRSQYQGARRNWLDYEEQLVRTVEQLKSEPDFAEEAEYGSALLISLRHFDGKEPVHEVVRVLTEHVKAFPGGKTNVKLFLAYAGSLAMKHRRVDAIRCCGVAQWLLKDHPQIGLIHQFKQKVSTGDLITMAQLRDEQLKEARANDETQKRIEREVTRIREMMPIKVDPITTLTDVTTDWHTINYTYRVTAPRNEIMKKRKEIETRITGTAKSTFGTMELLSKGVTLNYRYNDKGDWFLFEFSISQ